MRTVALCAVWLAFGYQSFASEPQSIFTGNGSESPKQPQAFFDAQGVVHLTFGVGEQVFYSRSQAGRIKAPQPAFRIPNMSLGMRRGPRIAASPKAIVITAIGGEQGKGKDGDVRAYRSFDQGQTWQGPSRVNDQADSAREGLHAMSVADGVFYCVWLDLRAKRTELYLSKSTDAGESWSPNTLVYRSPDRNICECCHPSLVCDGANLHILFRNSIQGNRDMYVISSHDAGETFGQAKRLGFLHWELNACPMDGGMLALSKSGQTTAVWRRGGTIFVSRPDTVEEIPVGKGEQSFITMVDDQPHVVWTSAREGDLLYSKLDDQAPQQIATGARDPVVVANAAKPSQVMVFWESRDGDKISIMSQVLNESGNTNR